MSRQTLWAILSDIDGTLLNRGGVLDPETADAAATFIRAGGFFAFASGRSVDESEVLAKEIRVNAPCILLNGALFYDFSAKRVLHSEPMGPEVHESMECVLRRYPRASIHAYTENRTFLIRDNDIVRKKGVIRKKADAPVDHRSIPAPICKLTITSEPEELHTIIAECFGGAGISATRSSRHFIEAVSAGAGKGNGLERFLARLRIPRERVAAIGDSYNDADMLKRAGYALCMGNAPDEIQKLCARVLPDNASFGAARGIACVLERMTGVSIGAEVSN